MRFSTFLIRAFFLRSMARLSEKVIGQIRYLHEQGRSQEEIMQATGVSPSSVHVYTQYQSRAAYANRFARRNGYRSYGHYLKTLARRHKQETKYQKFSALLARQLKKLNMTQTLLAEQVRCTKQAISLYAQGAVLPRPRLFRRICSALEVPYRTIDDLLQNNR
jgi:transcriptional regulator with XRE-family HTH domain